jgi:hypothetical protein
MAAAARSKAREVDSMAVQKKILGIAGLKPDPRNANKGTARGAQMISDSIEELGAGRSILADKHGVVIAGNKTLDAFKRAGKSKIRVVESDGETLIVVQRTDLDLKLDERAKLLGVADNRAGEISLEWDPAVLVSLSEEIDLGAFFDPAEMLALLGEQDAGEGLGVDDTPEPPATPRTKRGDVYELGRHRLMCGDATSEEQVDRLLAGDKVHLVHTDPPYGISIVKCGKVGGDKPFGAGAGKRGKMFDARTMKAKPILANPDYAPIIGDETIETAVAAYELCARRKIAVLIFWGGNYYASRLPPSSCWIVWDKETGESFFADAELAWTNQKTAVRLFRHQWSGLIKASERGEKRVHPTQKPVALAAWCIEQYGKSGDVVLDLFGGSGSTLIACEQSDRLCRTMEMSEAYCDVIVTRWERLTGGKARLVK